MTDRNRQAKRSAGAATTAVGAAVIVAALATTACTKDTPTQPTSDLTAATALAIAPAARTAAGELLNDASGRLMPSLGDAIARAKLRGYLDDLTAALEADNVVKARRQIALARKTIAALADSPDAADLAVLGIALDEVEVQLDGSSEHVEP